MRNPSTLLATTLAVVLTSGLWACASPDAPAPAAKTEAADAASDPKAADAAVQKEETKVNKTASGLQYEVLTEGSGAKPSATDTVTVHYEGRLTDGTVFDSSHKRGQPATFPLNRVIRGWTEGLQLMTVGSKYRLTIPPDLGYGASGVPGTIPPDATLVFDVELLGIQ